MANIKSKNISKSKNKHFGCGKSKKCSTGTKASLHDVVMKRPSKEMMLFSPDEKVQYVLQNGHRLKEVLLDKIPKTDVNIDKNDLPITKEKLLSKSGRIKVKTKDKLRLIDDILKRELMIQDTNDNVTSANKIAINKPISFTNNNNNCEISNQNKTKSVPIIENDSLSPNEKLKTDKRRKKKCDSQKNSKTKQVTLSNGVVLTLSLFECDYCHKTFSSKSSIRRHIYTHLNLKLLECELCPKLFRLQSTLKAHTEKEHANLDKGEYYVCDICDKPFYLKENLVLHVSSHIKSENSYKCVYCDKQFSHHIMLIQHEKQHLVTGKYQCSVCKMSYDCRSRLALHVKGHLKIKEFVCQFCGKEFLRPNSIKRHVQVCHGGFRIQCPICKKNLKGHLTEHMRTHEKKRPHECPDCGQRFTQSTQLNVHRRNHTGARPYPCRICGQPFSHSNALMLHIRRHTGEKPFCCAMCPLSFTQLPHMKAHMRNIHGQENPYRCKKCLQFYKLKTDLETHSKKCKAGDETVGGHSKTAKVEEESPMTLSRMRFLLALLLTMIATKDKLKCLVN